MDASTAPNVTPAGDCVFCAIVGGRAEASVVHDDAEILGIVDLRPVTTGHLLVLPKAHHETLAALPSAVGARMFEVASVLAAALRRTGLPCDGINLFVADGSAAGQEVPHAHLHVIPRFPGDGVVIQAQWRVRDRAELDDIAARVRAELGV